MNAPGLELGDIFRLHGPDYLTTFGDSLSGEQKKTLRAIALCRTAALGGHVEQCDQCGYHQISYCSCRNRHCPKCSARARAQWLGQRAAELLPVEYFHVVFTLPQLVAPLALQNQRLVYGMLFRAAAETLLQIAPTPGTSVPDSAFWRCCILGDKTCIRTLTHNAWHHHLLDLQGTTQLDCLCDPLVAGACLSGGGDRECCEPVLCQARSDELPKEHAGRLVRGSIGRPPPAVRWNGGSRRIAELLHSS